MSQYDDSHTGDDQSEETGLNLFDDRASAAGSFPHAMMGYDRSTVDNYVRDLEQRLSAARQLNRDRLRDLESLKSEQGTTDFTRLGAHATNLLRAAEAQADDLVTKAGVEAERIKMCIRDRSWQ